MLPKYLFLIFLIKKTIEITSDVKCGNDPEKIYNYYILECVNSNGKSLSKITNIPICGNNQIYKLSIDNTLSCTECINNGVPTNSTPDGFYCTPNNITDKVCNETEYYDDFQSIKTEIICSSKKRNLISNNNINLRKTQTQTQSSSSSHIYYFEENLQSKKKKDEYRNSGSIDISDLENTNDHENFCALLIYNDSKKCSTYFETNNDELLNTLWTFKVVYNEDYNQVEVSSLRLFLKKIYFNGTADVPIELTNQFIFCSHTYNDEMDFRRFGIIVDNHCYIDLERFKDNPKEPIFYEIFIHNGDNNAELNLERVPILIDNIDNENTTNTFSSTNIHLNNETNLSNWKLVYRMFLHENYINENYITYAKSIKFRVKMKREGSSAQIYRPFFEVFYSTRNIENLKEYPKAYVSFQSEYYTEIKHFMSVMLGLLIAACVIVGIIVIYRIWVWIKVNPRDLSPDSWFIDLLVTIIFTLCRFFGVFMFWFCLIISSYWYFFYKLQSRIYLLLPPLRQYDEYYKKFDIIFGLGCATYISYMIFRIYRQVSFDIFFIDWEQEKEIFKNANSSDDIAVVSKYRRYRGAWRMLHVANQFNALQSKRTISLYFSFCWFILFYYRCKWYTREKQVPNIHDTYNAPVNFILRHFLASIIVITAGAIQIIIVRFLQLWIPLKKQEFLDLCSVSNISVFLLDEKLHGYYIHGQAPFGKADANLDELLRFLDEERKGKVRQRGVSGNNEDDIQSYEMYISYVMRTIYDGLYYIQNEAFYAQNQPDLQKVIDERRLGAIFKFIPDLAKKENLDYLNTYMNSELKNKIENVSSNDKIYIKEKNMMERILCYPPDNVELKKTNSQEILLYKDPNLSFDDVLFSGMEWEWFIMDVYLFQLWMRILDDTEIAIFLTYIIDYTLAFVRKFFGEKNVAKKAVIDERFFS